MTQKKFYEELEKQNSWGKNQIKTMLLEVIVDLYNEQLL